MIELIKLHKLVNDYIQVQDIDLIRTLANDVLADIDNVSGGVYSLMLVSPVLDRIQLSKSVIKVISVSLNGIALKQISNQDIFQLKDMIKWYESPRYFVYSFLNPYSIKLIHTIPDYNVDDYRFTIEALVRDNRFITSSADIPDYYVDLLAKGILAKLLLHPKHLNPELANQYQSVYQNALQNNFNGA